MKTCPFLRYLYESGSLKALCSGKHAALKAAQLSVSHDVELERQQCIAGTVRVLPFITQQCCKNSHSHTHHPAAAAGAAAEVFLDFGQTSHGHVCAGHNNLQLVAS